LDAEDERGAAALAATGRIAITAANVTTLYAVQLKGTASDIEPADAADYERAAAYIDLFFADIQEGDGPPRENLDRIAAPRFSRCRLEITELFDQTPGPAAGTKFEPSAS